MEHNPPTMGDYAYAAAQDAQRQSEYAARSTADLNRRVAELESLVQQLYFMVDTLGEKVFHEGQMP